MSTHQRIILLSGIPASGKTNYAEWLESSKGYRHLNMDLALSENPQFQPGRWLELVRPTERWIVIDWGFHPDDLATVERLVSLGARPWWLDGDRAAAKRRFDERHAQGAHESPPEAFDPQMARIERSWTRIEEVFGGRIIHTIGRDGVYVDREVIFNKMGLHRSDGAAP